jgi:NAD(P)-dependent dehydrogenase (short-subunit alcohol dehydrogenase family)
MTQFIWLVTGCSSGIGEAFIYEILARGDKVIATARNASARLGHLKDSGAAILDLDVTASESELSAKVAEAIQIYGNIDVLVNNAGIFEWGLIEETRQVVSVEGGDDGGY